MPIIGGRQASVRGLGFQGAGAPAQVAGLTATDIGSGRAFNSGRIDLAWTAPATNGAPITGYLIERSTNSGSTWSTLVANTGNTNVSYSDTGLTSSQRYDYRVSAINAAGTGLNSTAANATATTVPQAPTIGTVSRTSNTQVSVPFTAGATGGSAISSYVITSSPSVSVTTNAGTTSPRTATATYAGNQAYTFTIAAVNANGTSIASSSSNSITPFTPPTVTGGTLTSDATYYYRRFTANGTLSVTNGNLTADVLVVSGGGAGGWGNPGGNTGRSGAGGGAGGLVLATNQTLNTNYSITIGAGGPASNSSSEGSSVATASTFQGLTSPTRGGRGGQGNITINNGQSNTIGNGQNGGSGGGACFPGTGTRYGGTGTAGQGSAGGNNITSTAIGSSGGGGYSGSGSTGVLSAITSRGGSGGAGYTGFSGFGLAGGGGGGGSTVSVNNIDESNDSRGGASQGGGSGGGQAGYMNQNYEMVITAQNAGQNATANSGGGGGGGCSAIQTSPNLNPAGNGGSGTVIVRYTRSQVE